MNNRSRSSDVKKKKEGDVGQKIQLKIRKMNKPMDLIYNRNTVNEITFELVN